MGGGVRRCPVCGAPLRSAAGAWNHAFRHFEEAAREGVVAMERVGGIWVIRAGERVVVGAGWSALEELAPLLRRRQGDKGQGDPEAR